jgi:hypothetical protein
MDQDPAIIKLDPSALLQTDLPGDNRAELLAEIWEAAESLIAPDVMIRMAGVERLESYDAIRQLPLIAYLLTTRLTEPDIVLRTRIVKALGCVTGASMGSQQPDASVQKTLIFHLSQIRTREVFALLQVAEYDKSSEPCIESLLACCSFAGGHLSQILSARDTSLEIRRQATHFIGQLGYLDALPVLERMASRFETRTNDRDASLLMELQSAVQQLSAP